MVYTTFSNNETSTKEQHATFGYAWLPTLSSGGADIKLQIFKGLTDLFLEFKITRDLIWLRKLCKKKYL